MICKGLFLAVLLALTTGGASGKRLKNRIYKDVRTTGFCFRRTNGTHEIGCSSDLNGNVGVVHVVSDDADLDWVVEKGPHAPYMAVFFPGTFSHDALMRLKNSGRVSGVLLLNRGTDRPAKYSDDAACPNSVSGYYGPEQCDGGDPWNPAGFGTMFESFPFPIFMTTDESVESEVVQCFENFNRPSDDSEPGSWPLCALELKAHMYSSTDTTTCLRRSAIVNPFSQQKFCDEIADYNVMYFVEERNASEIDVDSEKVVVVTTQLDTFTMFDSNERGADAPSTNIVALLETAALVAENRADPGSSSGGEATNILFAFLNGEAFDYIGSSRMVYDMTEKSFPAKVEEGDLKNGHQPPLELKHIKEIITLGQLYNNASGESLFAHTDTSFSDTEMIRELKAEFRRQRGTLQDPTRNRGIPPSSIQSFLKKSSGIAGVHISDFDQEYTNQFFHGIYDTARDNLGGYSYALGENQPVVKQIATVSAAVANYLAKSLDGDSAPFIREANEKRINEMLHCYTEKSDCRLFNASSNANTPPFYTPFPDGPFPQYVGVDLKNMYHSIFTRNLLALLTAGDPLESIDKAEDCKTPADQNVFEYIFLKGEADRPDWNSTSDVTCSETPACGHCYKTTTFRHLAKSPAYVIDGYDFADAEYSAWAESVWKVTGARMFLMASPSLQLAHFFVGLFVFVSGAGLSYWGTKKAPELFDAAAGESGNSGSGTVATQDSTLAAGVAGGSEPTHL